MKADERRRLKVHTKRRWPKRRCAECGSPKVVLICVSKDPVVGYCAAHRPKVVPVCTRAR